MSKKIKLAKLRYFCLFVYLVISTSASADKKETDSNDSTGSDGDSLEVQQSQHHQDNVFDIGGVRVVSYTSLSELPEAASKVQFTSTIIDRGDGPIICMSGVLSSLPPGCSGPIVEGLVMGDWTETASGVPWGERTVVVSWPPDQDRKVTLFDERKVKERTRQSDAGSSWLDGGSPVPDECADLNWQNTVGTQRLSAWAKANPDITGEVSFYLNRDELEKRFPKAEEQLGSDADGALEIERVINTIGTGSLEVVKGNVDKAKDELSVDGKVPCIVEVEFSKADLRKVHDQILSEENIRTAGIIFSSYGEDKVNIGVAVADLSTVRIISESVENPSMLNISGRAKILEGE